MAPVPNGDVLECHGNPGERDLTASRELKAYRHAMPAEACRHCHGRVAGEIEGRRVALQLQDQFWLSTESANLLECKRGVRLHGKEQASILLRRCAKRPRSSMRRKRIAW